MTLRVLDCVGRMRRREAYHAVREALLVVAPREDFRVVHLSIQGNHIHLICEAASRAALSSGIRGIRALKISAARRLNGKLGREGAVFSDRYHVEPLGTPRQVRNCISYCLNWRRHDEDRHATWPIDLYSSAISFAGWQERPAMDVPATYLPLPVSAPRTWLLAVGWRKSGSISCRENPALSEKVIKHLRPAVPPALFPT